jgi:hypothetical protein
MNSLSVLNSLHRLLRIFYTTVKIWISHTVLGSLTFIWGSGKVIQISSTSFSAKIWLINSIWVRIKLHYANQFPRQFCTAPKRAPLYQFQQNFCQGIFRLSQQNILLYHSLIQVLMDCHSWKVFIPFLEEINHYYFFSCWLKTLVNVSFSWISLTYFCFPLYFKYFSLYNDLYWVAKLRNNIRPKDVGVKN